MSDQTPSPSPAPAAAATTASPSPLSSYAPTLGRIVHTKGCVTSNGTDEHAALVTRPWSESCVNVKVLPDCREPIDVCSVAFVQTREAALAYLAANPNGMVAFWPPRV